jgi:PAS domain S-box-containing protein
MKLPLLLESRFTLNTSAVEKRLRSMSTKRQPELRSPWSDQASSLARLYELTGRLLRSPDLNSGLKEILEAAIEVLGADMGNIQILDPARNVLEMIAHQGFHRDFLDFFREVSPEKDTACAHALRSGQRFIIEDVQTADFYAPFRAIAASAGYRSVQSTPLIGRGGALLGILSTHWTNPHRPPNEQLHWLDMYIRQAADLIERLRTEAALAEAAERERRLVAQTIEAIAKFRAVFDQSAVFAGIMTLDGTVVGANRICLEACGYKMEKVVGRVFWETPWWSGNTEVQDRIRAATLQAAKGLAYQAELPYVWADGSQHVVDFALHPIRDAHGKIIYLHPTGIDITERKNSEQHTQLLHSQMEHQARIFDATLSSITDFVYVFDRKGCFTYVNQALLDLWGIKLEDAIGKNFHDLKYPRDLATRLHSQIQQVFDTRKGIRDETPYTSPTGVSGYYEYIFSPVFGPTGDVAVVAGSTRDITQRKNTEEALRDAKNRLEATLISNEIATWTFDIKTNRVFADVKLARMFSVTPEDAAGGPITAYLRAIHPEDRARVESLISESLRPDRGQYETDYRLVQSDGSIRWVAARGKVQRDADGNPVRFPGVVIDITDRKRAEEMLKDSEHNLRTLAETLETQVLARTAELEQRNTDVLRQADELRDLSARVMQAQDQERRHIARELHDSAGQTLAVLGMHFARLSQEVKRHAPHCAKIADESDELIQQLNREIRTTSYLLHPPLLDEAGIATALNIYVRGLVERGALDATLDVPDDFGRLPSTLELMLFRIVQESLTNVIRHSGSKAAAIRLTRDTEFVNLEVRDSGKGIPPEKLADIRVQGSGVGIRGMRERVRQFAGTMKIDSTPTGTTIHITLPIPTQSS